MAVRGGLRDLLSVRIRHACTNISQTCAVATLSALVIFTRPCHHTPPLLIMNLHWIMLCRSSSVIEMYIHDFKCTHSGTHVETLLEWCYCNLKRCRIFYSVTVSLRIILNINEQRILKNKYDSRSFTYDTQRLVSVIRPQNVTVVPTLLPGPPRSSGPRSRGPPFDGVPVM